MCLIKKKTLQIFKLRTSSVTNTFPLEMELRTFVWLRQTMLILRSLESQMKRIQWVRNFTLTRFSGIHFIISFIINIK